MVKYFDITKPRYSERFLPVPWFCYSTRLYFGNDIVSRRLLQWIARIENGLKFRPCNNKIQDIQQPDKYEADSDNESTEEGNFEVVYGRTGREDRDHDWCVYIPRLVSY